jgi:predicted dehydrogenase
MTESSASPLRVVVAGTGFGCRIQVPALRGAGFEVVGLVGTNAARTAERAIANGVAKAFIDLGKAIDATSPDVIAISTPPFTHGPLSILALERGCHVLCEKPFARDSKEAKVMFEAARKSGKVHVIGNEFRFLPQRATVARAISEGMIGEPRLASLVQIMGFLSSFEADFPDWWFDPAQGGGWLGASGSHMVDQVRSWLGEFESVSASLINVGISRGEVEDSFALRFHLKNGVEGIMQQSSGAFGPMADMMQIVGTQGRIWIDGLRVRFADRHGVRDLPIPSDLVLPPPPPSSQDPRLARSDWKIMAEVEIAPYMLLCRALRAAITGEAPTSPVTVASFADGLANMQVLDAIRESAQQGGALVGVESG